METLMPYGLQNAIRLTGRDLLFLTRATTRKWRDDGSPLLLCNSFPKSGTHLLYQILSEVSGYSKWNDIVSIQSLSGTANSASHIRWKLGTPPGGSIVRSHLSHIPETNEILRSRNFVKYFVYRDLRDVVISSAKWNQKEMRSYLYNFFNDSSLDDHQRIAALISGIPLCTTLGSSISKDPLDQQFRQFSGWLNDPDTLAVRFEELVGSRGGGDDQLRFDAVDRILRHAGVEMSPSEIAHRFSVEKLDPRESQTFHRGMINTWREEFTPELAAAFEHQAGELNRSIGYPDEGWSPSDALASLDGA